MQNGQVGVIVIVVAVIFSAMGGYLFNAKEVTDCKSNFNYVTDVAGAFSNAGTDIGVEYDPITNLTGYSVYDPTDSTSHTNVIAGINYTESSPNAYWLEQNSGNTTAKILTFTNIKPIQTSGSYPISGNGTIAWDDQTRTVQYANDWFGTYFELIGSYVASRVTIDNWDNNRATGFTINQILDAYGVPDTNSIIMQVDTQSNSYPAFINYTGISTYSENVPGNAMKHNSIAQINYSDYSNSINVNPRSGTVIMNNQTYNWDQILFVWGTYADTTATMTMMIGSDVELTYINPVNGVQPTGFQTTTTTVISTTSKATQVGGMVEKVSLLVSDNFDGSFFVVQNNTQIQLFTFSLLNKMWKINGQLVASGGTASANDQYSVSWTWDKSNYDTIQYEVFAGTNTVTGSILSYNLLNVDIDAIGVNISITTSLGGASSGSTVATLTDITHNQSQQVSNTTFPYSSIVSSMNTESTSYETVTQTTNYDTTYWANGYINTNFEMLIKKESGLTNSFIIHAVKTDGSNHNIPLTIDCDYGGNSGWIVNGVAIGSWPAIYLKYTIVENHSVIYVFPVTNMVTFLDYTVLDYEYMVYNGQAIADKGAKYIEFQYTDDLTQFYHEIGNTVVLLEQGGLYLQNGVFSPAVSFPNDKIIQFKIMGSPHVGDSVTITTYDAGTDTYTPYTYQVNSYGTGLIIGNTSFKFADISWYFVAENVPNTIIGSDVYSGGLYLNGKFYEKGHLYMKLGKSTDLIDLGVTNNQWTLKLDGTWAVSTAYYTGDNIASSKLLWDDPGQWQWNLDLTLMVFIALIIIGLVICNRFWEFGWMDWVIPISACVIALLMLG